MLDKCPARRPLANYPRIAGGAPCDAAAAPAAGTERISCSLLPRSSSDSGAHMLRASGDSAQGWVQEASGQAACQRRYSCAVQAAQA